MRTPVIALASLLLVAGCSTVESGEPKAVGEPVTTTEHPGEPTETSETSETPPPTEGPRRPRDIDLTGVDICKVVSDLPLRKYGLDGRAPVGGTSQIFPGNKDCFAGGIDKNLALTLIAVTDQDAGEFVETANAQVTEFDAQGYPLSVLKPAQQTNCFGVLDVHDGQLVWIAYGLGSPTERPVTPQDQLCKTVPMIAASAVAALG
jgi:Protein of unknown function (DUF3558)